MSPPGWKFTTLRWQDSGRGQISYGLCLLPSLQLNYTHFSTLWVVKVFLRGPRRMQKAGTQTVNIKVRVS